MHRRVETIEGLQVRSEEEMDLDGVAMQHTSHTLSDISDICIQQKEGMSRKMSTKHACHATTRRSFDRHRSGQGEQRKD